MGQWKWCTRDGAKNPDPTPSIGVPDINGAAWLLADDAWFIMNSGLRTPMGTGIAVTADEQSARALAFDQAEAVVMTFAEILARAEAGGVLSLIHIWRCRPAIQGRSWGSPDH